MTWFEGVLANGLVLYQVEEGKNEVGRGEGLEEGFECPSGGLDLICYSSFLMKNFIQRFMAWIDYSGSSMKDGFGQGNSGGTETQVVAVGMENKGLI